MTCLVNRIHQRFAIDHILFQVSYYLFRILYRKMDKYCTNPKTKAFGNITENRDNNNKKFENYNTPKSQIRECFKEYSLEEKVNVLKNILVHNDKHMQTQLSRKQNICKIQKGIGVKECLQPSVNETPFQTIISELRNTVMNSYWNKEVGKTRYQISNLPVGMDPLTVTFGKRCVSGENMTEIFQTKTEDIDDLGRNIHEMYKKSHNSYLPGEKINRNYKKPFDQNFYFGKLLNVDDRSTGVKKRLTWFNTDTNTVVNSNLADFIERTHSCVGEVKNLKSATLYTNMRHGKLAEKREATDSLSILSDCPVNNDVIAQQKYLEYINSLRQTFKKCDREIFSDILEDLLSSDKDYTGILSEEKVYSILGKHKVHINKSILAPLLDLLQIREEQSVKYTELLNLLNWRYDFPTLPKIERIPLNCQHYSTTYSTMLAGINQVDMITIPVAGLSYKDLDKMTAYSLIFPNIFTKYGLSPSDLSKPRNKEEIKNIFEAIGIQFPNDSYEFLWKEGLKKGGTGNVSVETFSNLLDENYNLISKKTN